MRWLETSARMPSHEYHFLTTWRVEASAEEVYAVLQDPTQLPRWWPAVYLEVTTVERGGELGVGRVTDLFTKGWLPYTLRWRFRLTESEPPRRFVLEASGDFVGRGEWTLEDRAGGCDIRYDWRVAAEKPLLRALSFALKPIFAANHRWAMARGEESLRLELLRRRAPTPEARAAIAQPPSPTWPHRARGPA